MEDLEDIVKETSRRSSYDPCPLFNGNGCWAHQRNNVAALLLANTEFSRKNKFWAPLAIQLMIRAVGALVNCEAMVLDASQHYWGKKRKLKKRKKWWLHCSFFQGEVLEYKPDSWLAVFFEEVKHSLVWTGEIAARFF